MIKYNKKWEKIKLIILTICAIFDIIGIFLFSGLFGIALILKFPILAAGYKELFGWNIRRY